MTKKYRVLGGVAFILSAIAIVAYFKYSDIETVEDIRIGWGLVVGLVLSLLVVCNPNRMIENRVAEDRKLVTGFERFSILQMRLILTGVILFVIGVGIWIYCVLR